MVNTFKHTGFITLADGTSLPYAFGPNQARILDQLRGWEFWQHQEQVLPALYAVAAYSQLQSTPDADPEQLAQAAEAARKSLWNDPTFVQDFYYSALAFGADLAGEPFAYNPAQVGMLQQQEPTAFLPALVHYSNMQTERINVANARPTTAPKTREAAKKAKTQ